MKKVLFIYPENREQLISEVKTGLSPDNALYGLNFFKENNLQVYFKDVSSRLEKTLDIIFFPLHRLFLSQIDIDFKLGRALLLLPYLNKADCIVVNTDGIGLALCLLRRLKLIKKPIVYAVGLFYIKGGLESSIVNNRKTTFFKTYKWILDAADQILYHAQIEKEKLVKLGIYNPAKCTFVAMGSDASFFKSSKFKKIKTLDNTIVSVGKDRARDYKTLLNSAKKIPDVSFIIVCREANIRGLEIPKNVNVNFNLPYLEVANLYNQATVIVIPIKEMHRSSGQMTLTDCLQCSKPIIISDVEGISHYKINNNVNVIKVLPQNSELLQRSIKNLLKNKSLQTKLINGTKKLARIYSTKQYSQKLKEIVHSSLEELRLKPIVRSDLEFMRKIRNENSSFFINDERPISQKDQQKWFENYLQEDFDFMFILMKEDIKIGVGAIYDIDVGKKSAEMGRLIVDKKYRGYGYGKILIQRIEKLTFENLKIENINLKVLANNAPAIKLYKNLGYLDKKSTTLNGKKVILMGKSTNTPRLAVYSSI